MKSPPSVLIVDDEPGIRESLKGVLEDEGFECSRRSPTGEMAVEEILNGDL
ncbi:MAG: hypothetical protein QM757_13970 [Paludibaculum sp.]